MMHYEPKNRFLITVNRRRDQPISLQNTQKKGRNREGAMPPAKEFRPIGSTKVKLVENKLAGRKGRSTSWTRDEGRNKVKWKSARASQKGLLRKNMKEGDSQKHTGIMNSGGKKDAEKSHPS